MAAGLPARVVGAAPDWLPSKRREGWVTLGVAHAGLGTGLAGARSAGLCILITPRAPLLRHARFFCQPARTHSGACLFGHVVRQQ